MTRTSIVFSILFAIWAVCLTAQEQGYDPLATPSITIQTADFSLQDQVRNRTIPIRVYLPPEQTSRAVILFSHGLGGSCTNNPYLGNHWAASGYVVVFVQHPGSDNSVWKEIPRRERMAAMKRAANVENFMLRVKDIPTVIDRLTLWNSQQDHLLYQRMDLERIGMSGHSFGASTTQAVSGQRYWKGSLSYTDPRIKAAVMFSPTVPQIETDFSRSFGQVKVPWLLMTGTLDKSFIASYITEDRIRIFPALPPGGKYELVLYKAEHSAFSDHNLPGDQQPKNPNHHRVIKALSTAFWDAWLYEKPEAKQWLDGEGAKSVLETNDSWRRK